MFKKYVQRRLEKYVKKYFKKHPEVKLIAIVGSVGKTTTRNIIGTLLSEKYRVGGELGENFNTELSAPVGILGVKYPENPRSVREWLAVFRAARLRVRQPATVDLIIQELGADKPGDMAVFERYLRPDLTVLTGITPEHMEFFKTMDAVAYEESLAINFSKMGVINRDDIDGQYAKFINNPHIVTYGSSPAAENRIEIVSLNVEKGYYGKFFGPRAPEGFDVKVRVFGEQVLRGVAAAIAVALEMGLTPEEVQRGLTKVVPTPGRMNVLKGLKQSVIIDDSYNSSPAAAREALRALYSFPTEGNRIAVLGSMNELGETSAVAHQEIGALCNPNLLEWVVTVGAEARQFLAPAAAATGCQVKSFDNALQAGAFVNKVLYPRSVVLFKGSQDKIFLEEAVKIILLNSDDNAQLVRQSESWIKRKNVFFESFSNIPEDN